MLVVLCSSLSAADLTTAPASGSEKSLNPLLAMAIVVVFQAADLEGLTRGYVSLEPTGIFSVEKFFEKNGIELRLLGMAHVAEKGFYQDIKDSLQGKTALMLMEGVTDKGKLLKKPLDYSAFAEKLGVDNQRDKFSPKEMPENVEVIRADLDTSDFSTGTVELLNFAGEIYSGKGFNFGSLLMMYLRLSDVSSSQAFMKDLITKRNECLINHLKENMSRHNLILVPWGALHLPEIEKWAANNGFALKTRKSRTLLRFPHYFKYFLPEKKENSNSTGSARTLSEILGI